MLKLEASLASCGLELALEASPREDHSQSLAHCGFGVSWLPDPVICISEKPPLLPKPHLCEPAGCAGERRVEGVAGKDGGRDRLESVVCAGNEQTLHLRFLSWEWG